MQTQNTPEIVVEGEQEDEDQLFNYGEVDNQKIRESFGHPGEKDIDYDKDRDNKSKFVLKPNQDIDMSDNLSQIDN